LLQLVKTSEDPKTKGEANCLATYEMESFEFLLSMTIWYCNAPIFELANIEVITLQL
jgi:hypothetical protein